MQAMPAGTDEAPRVLFLNDRKRHARHPYMAPGLHRSVQVSGNGSVSVPQRAFLPVRTYLCLNRLTGSADSRAAPAKRNGRMMEAFISMRIYPNDPSCPEILPTGISGERAETAHGSPSLTVQAAFDAMRKTADGPRKHSDPAGLAVPFAGAGSDAGRSCAVIGVSRRADQDIPIFAAMALFSYRAGYHTTLRGVKSSSRKGRGQ